MVSLRGRGASPPSDPEHGLHRMTHNVPWPRRWLTSLPSVLLFGSVLIRSAIVFRDSPALLPVLAALFIGAALFAVESRIHNRWPIALHAYVALQSGLVYWLMTGPGKDEPTFLAVLLIILSMGVVARLPSAWAGVWLGVFTVLIAIPVVRAYSLLEGGGFVLLLSAMNVFFGLYARAVTRAREAWVRNEELVERLSESNEQLLAASAQKEQLAAARARHLLARELHDSVTQTAFSMNLAAQTATLLLERDPARLGAQLDHFERLARTALTQMQTLIAELRPETGGDGDLASALRRDLAERQLPESLAISVRADGFDRLRPGEERVLFSIAREAVNNIVKHAQASRGSIRLHLTGSPSMEVSDEGKGFDTTAALPPGRVGLAGMREQAEEIGWDLELTSSPGSGTCLRVARRTLEERPL
jgi:signal transduction histidine kinase